MPALSPPAHRRFGQKALASQRRAGRDHRRAACADRLDDLAAIDPLQVDRGDPEVGMSQLALDDVERDALPGHLDSMGVAQLVRSEAAPYPGLGRSASKRDSYLRA